MPIFKCLPIFACKGKADSLDYSCQTLDNVPEAIFKHGKYLEDLNLSMNNITELQPSFFKLTGLQRLILSNNRLNVIPAEIGELKNLVELDVSNNSIMEVASELGKCRNLMILNFSQSDLPPDALPESIVNLNRLTHLILSSTSLTALPSDIDKLENLRWLDASNCHIRLLPTNIGKLKNLQKLDVGSNSINDLPASFAELTNLRELDLDNNTIDKFPEALLSCKSLESLILGENALRELPSNIGELSNLRELDVNKNHIYRIPTSIRLLSSLRILKLNDNCIDDVPLSIGSLSQLQELYLNSNQLRELPSSIGHCTCLTFLDVSCNELESLPPTIGSLSNLGCLLLRGNQLRELPSEVGKLSKLTVLDVVDNDLRDLPYTLVAIKDTLRALFLAHDRPIKIASLQEGVGAYNIKVLTNFMLPQKDYVAQDGRNAGGERVRFYGDTSLESQMEGNEERPPGKFERLDTPHPKERVKYQKALQAKRTSKDFSQLEDTILSADDVQMRPLRSVRSRPVSMASVALEASTSGLQAEFKSVIVRRQNGTVGWNIMGGSDSALPFKDGDFGFFVSKTVPGGPAEQAGIVVGDKILAVNGRPVHRLTHKECVDLITHTADPMELQIEPCASTPLPTTRKTDSRMSLVSDGPPTSFAPICPNSLNSEARLVTTDLISVPIRCDADGNPGLTVSGGMGRIVIKDIVPGGAAAETRKLRSGDRLLSINGQQVQSLTLQEVTRMLQAPRDSPDLYLNVERLHFNSTTNLMQGLVPSRSMPFLYADALLEGQQQQPVSHKPTHARKPSGDFSSSGLIQFSHEPVNRSRSITNLYSDITLIDAPVAASPVPEKPTSPKTSQLRQPMVIVHTKEHSSSSASSTKSTPFTGPESVSTSVREPVVAKESPTRIPQPTKIPPPVAPKPKLPSEQKPGEQLSFMNKLAKFEQMQKSGPDAVCASKPPKKQLVSQEDAEKIREEELRKCSIPSATTEEESGVYSASPSTEFNNMLEKIVAKPTIPSATRTRSAFGAASTIECTSPVPSVAISSSLPYSRCESASSGNMSIDISQLEQLQQRRKQRMNGVDKICKEAEELISKFSPITANQA